MGPDAEVEYGQVDGAVLGTEVDLGSVSHADGEDPVVELDVADLSPWEEGAGREAVGQLVDASALWGDSKQ